LTNESGMDKRGRVGIEESEVYSSRRGKSPVKRWDLNTSNAAEALDEMKEYE
jgi:hypothetical protein